MCCIKLCYMYNILCDTSHSTHQYSRSNLFSFFVYQPQNILQSAYVLQYL